MKRCFFFCWETFRCTVRGFHHVFFFSVSQVKGMVSLIIPLRDVSQVEKVDNQTDPEVHKSILISLKNEPKSVFLFSQIKDRDFLIAKISELLAKVKM